MTVCHESDLLDLFRDQPELELVDVAKELHMLWGGVVLTEYDVAYRKRCKRVNCEHVFYNSVRHKRKIATVFSI